MRNPARLAIITLASVAAIGGGWAAAAWLDDPPGDDSQPAIAEPARQTPTTPATASSSGTPSTPTTALDISGNCDEAEHADDPGCAGVVLSPAPTTPPAPGTVDVSGPCDEAAHVNDPRCTGGAVAGDDGEGDRGHGSDDGPGHD
jgi:hypothetical protein